MRVGSVVLLMYLSSINSIDLICHHSKLRRAIIPTVLSPEMKEERHVCRCSELTSFVDRLLSPSRPPALDSVYT